MPFFFGKPKYQQVPGEFALCAYNDGMRRQTQHPQHHNTRHETAARGQEGSQGHRATAAAPVLQQKQQREPQGGGAGKYQRLEQRARAEEDGGDVKRKENRGWASNFTHIGGGNGDGNSNGGGLKGHHYLHHGPVAGSMAQQQEMNRETGYVPLPRLADSTKQDPESAIDSTLYSQVNIAASQEFHGTAESVSNHALPIAPPPSVSNLSTRSLQPTTITATNSTTPSNSSCALVDPPITGPAQAIFCTTGSAAMAHSPFNLFYDPFTGSISSGVSDEALAGYPYSATSSGPTPSSGPSAGPLLPVTLSVVPPGSSAPVAIFPSKTSSTLSCLTPTIISPSNHHLKRQTATVTIAVGASPGRGQAYRAAPLLPRSVKHATKYYYQGGASDGSPTKGVLRRELLHPGQRYRGVGVTKRVTAGGVSCSLGRIPRAEPRGGQEKPAATSVVYSSSTLPQQPPTIFEYTGAASAASAAHAQPYSATGEQESAVEKYNRGFRGCQEGAVTESLQLTSQTASPGVLDLSENERRQEVLNIYSAYLNCWADKDEHPPHSAAYCGEGGSGSSSEYTADSGNTVCSENEEERASADISVARTAASPGESLQDDELSRMAVSTEAVVATKDMIESSETATTPANSESENDIDDAMGSNSDLECSRTWTREGSCLSRPVSAPSLRTPPQAVTEFETEEYQATPVSAEVREVAHSGSVLYSACPWGSGAVKDEKEEEEREQTPCPENQQQRAGIAESEDSQYQLEWFNWRSRFGRRKDETTCVIETGSQEIGTADGKEDGKEHSHDSHNEYHSHWASEESKKDEDSDNDSQLTEDLRPQEEDKIPEENKGLSYARGLVQGFLQFIAHNEHAQLEEVKEKEEANTHEQHRPSTVASLCYGPGDVLPEECLSSDVIGYDLATWFENSPEDVVGTRAVDGSAACYTRASDFAGVRPLPKLNVWGCEKEAIDAEDDNDDREIGEVLGVEDVDANKWGMWRQELAAFEENSGEENRDEGIGSVLILNRFHSRVTNVDMIMTSSDWEVESCNKDDDNSEEENAICVEESWVKCETSIIEDFSTETYIQDISSQQLQHQEGGILDDKSIEYIASALRHFEKEAEIYEQQQQQQHWARLQADEESLNSQREGGDAVATIGQTGLSLDEKSGPQVQRQQHGLMLPKVTTSNSVVAGVLESSGGNTAAIAVSCQCSSAPLQMQQRQQQQPNLMTLSSASVYSSSSSCSSLVSTYSYPCSCSNTSPITPLTTGMAMPSAQVLVELAHKEGFRREEESGEEYAGLSSRSGNYAPKDGDGDGKSGFYRLCMENRESASSLASAELKSDQVVKGLANPSDKRNDDICRQSDGDIPLSAAVRERDQKAVTESDMVAAGPAAKPAAANESTSTILAAAEASQETLSRDSVSARGRGCNMEASISRSGSSASCLSCSSASSSCSAASSASRPGSRVVSSTAGPAPHTLLRQAAEPSAASTTMSRTRSNRVGFDYYRALEKTRPEEHAHKPAKPAVVDWKWKQDLALSNRLNRNETVLLLGSESPMSSPILGTAVAAVTGALKTPTRSRSMMAKAGVFERPPPPQQEGKAGGEPIIRLSREVPQRVRHDGAREEAG